MDGSEEPMNKKHCTTITRLPQNHITIIYLLMLHYWYKNHKDNTSIKKGDIPYNGRSLTKNNRGLSFKLHNIPEGLQKILVKYLETISK